jgi:serine/threonine-protein kinase RsbW
VDDGRPFDPRRGPSLDLHAESREAGGLGLLLVLHMVDVLRYRRMDDKNQVEVRVRMIGENENGGLSEATSDSPEPNAK